MNDLPLVFERHGGIYTSSLDVAAIFEKGHNHVLRDIREIVKTLSEGGHLSNFGCMFEPSSREVEIGNGGIRLDPCYDLTRDGFTLLAMGFTGAKALEFKIRYIDAFNAMEAALRGSRPIHGRNASSRDDTDVQKLHKVEMVRRISGPRAALALYVALGLPTVPEMFAPARQADLPFTVIDGGKP